MSGFSPTVRDWFHHRFGRPSAPQRRGWPAIRAGHHTLIASPTGTGKTLAAFLWAIDTLFRPVPRRDLVRVLRIFEVRGEVRGGRFVGGFPGEQFALPAAIEQLREGRRRGVGAPLSVG
ncbi:MAG: DEAD/DEAH box helicase, partial [Acidobacteriota bacterium]